ncbi:hypothetical protein LFM09_14395 [Lentzea alba]|uniref:hypothetical protein n=1 Tax=Lentzea alba TaxID=2714351 RepID=UPI0039BF61C3
MTFPYDQAQLQALIERVDTAVGNVDKTATEAGQVQPRSRGMSEQDFREFERFAKGPNAPKELKELQQRVDRGDFSWEDVAAGRVNDPSVQQGLAAGIPDLRRAYVAIQEGEDVDDIISAGSTIAPQTPPSRPARPSGDDDEDGPSVFKEDAW